MASESQGNAVPQLKYVPTLAIQSDWHVVLRESLNSKGGVSPASLSTVVDQRQEDDEVRQQVQALSTTDPTLAAALNDAASILTSPNSSYQDVANQSAANPFKQYPHRFWLSFVAPFDQNEDLHHLESSVALNFEPPKTGAPSLAMERIPYVTPFYSQKNMEIKVISPLHITAAWSVDSYSINQLICAPQREIAAPKTASIAQFDPTSRYLHPSAHITCLDISPDNIHGISGSEGGYISLWEAHPNSGAAPTLQLVKRLDTSTETDVRLAHFFPSSSVAITASDDLSLNIWSLSHNSIVCSLAGHKRPTTSIIFDQASKGRSLISTSLDGNALLWDVSTQQPVSAFKASTSTVTQEYIKALVGGRVVPSNTDISILSIELNDSILIDPTGSPLLTDGLPNSHRSMSGNLLLTACSDGVVRGFDTRMGSSPVIFAPSKIAFNTQNITSTTSPLVFSAEPLSRSLQSLGVGASPGTFWSGTSEGQINLHDLRTLKPFYGSILSSDSISNATFKSPTVSNTTTDDSSVTKILSMSGNHIFTSHSTGAVHIWKYDPNTEDSLSIVGQLSGNDCEPVSSLVFSNSHAFTGSFNSIRSYSFPKNLLELI